MVPNGWVKSKISDIANIAVGRDLKEGSYSENENDNFPFPVYSNTVSARGLYGFYNFAEYSNEAVTVVGRGIGIGIGTAFSRKEPFGAIGRLLVLEPKNNAFDVVYFENYINNYLRVHHENGAIPQLPGASIAKYDVVLPPLLEQQKIAKILSTWDKAISITVRLIENSTQQKKALMQKLLTGKKRLLDDEGRRFEGEWEEAKLSKWLIEYKEKSTTQDQYDVYTSSRNGLVLQSDYFANSRIAGRDNIGFHVIPPNHITYRSRSDDGFFTFNLFSSDKNGLISNYYPVFSTKGINEFFIALFEQYRAVFGRYSVGTSQKVLSLNALKDISFKIPNLPEQQKIATLLTHADKEIELLEQQLADLQQEKKALMQVLLTGKKRVRYNEN